jgi:hypothetical protein
MTGLLWAINWEGNGRSHIESLSELSPERSEKILEKSEPVKTVFGLLFEPGTSKM